jgi:adenosylcobalamin-dependent ribonucleoside-triphosphate reductase
VGNTDFLSFKLADDFVSSYEDRQVPWGFPIGGGNSLGELTFLTKYSRRKSDGTKERWLETCRRVIEGTFTIQKDWCKENRLPWNERKAQATAQDAYERLFVGKWTPPGRGLWMMGTEFVHAGKNSAALQNCSFLSTESISSRSVHDAVWPFVRLMEMSMLGVGVGFDTKGAGKLEIHQPNSEIKTFIVPDSREGWFESVSILLESYFFANRNTIEFDYSQVRPSGEPIKGFGGVAAGPGPLIDLHFSLKKQFDNRAGERITATDIVDIQNKIGKCVVSGNVRRSAEIALGSADDEEFLNLKNWEINPERMGANGWGHTSNNSIVANVGDNFDNIATLIADNGEPGIVWLDLCREFGRLVDPADHKDWRAAGTNPCSEQTLESGECCTLVENFISRHDSLEDFNKTLKVSYLYAKSVTLLPTHWPETNAIMQRNRRIGCSVSGLAHFAEMHGWTELRTWLDTGYNNIQVLDNKYSEWLGCRSSIKTTSVKPSGTVSLLFGVTPGVHWPTADVYIRRMRFASNDPLLDALAKAGYKSEPDVMDPTHSVVVELPTVGPDVRTEREVSMWEKASLAILAQRYWADNQVSVTVTFTDDEKSQISALLRSIDGQLKSVSMLPLLEVGGAYAQMPYERIDIDTWNTSVKKIKGIGWSGLYAGNSLDAEGEKYCSNDTCEI